MTARKSALHMACTTYLEQEGAFQAAGTYEQFSQGGHQDLLQTVLSPHSGSERVKYCAPQRLMDWWYPGCSQEGGVVRRTG